MSSNWRLPWINWDGVSDPAYGLWKREGEENRDRFERTADGKINTTSLSDLISLSKGIAGRFCCCCHRACSEPFACHPRTRSVQSRRHALKSLRFDLRDILTFFHAAHQSGSANGEHLASLCHVGLLSVLEVSWRRCPISARATISFDVNTYNE